MISWRHWLRFNGVSALGIVVQLAALSALVHAGLPYQHATPVAVAVAVLHNFVWHRRWTWRTAAPISRRDGVSAFARFAMANGGISLLGNSLFMPALVDGLGLGVIPANLMAVALCGVVNFWLAAALVFRPLVVPSAMMSRCSPRVSE
jgi:putative flippase GtrA